MTDASHPTRVRHRIIAVTMLTAFILYLDRICMGEIVKSVSFNQDIQLSKQQIGTILGAFFFSYALFQVPAGWASDRFGTRPTLTLYILLWSVFTGLTGLVSNFAGLFAARLLCGFAEAGAYPTAMAIVRRWIPLEGRARAAGLVALGGRVGGTLAPFLTIWMILTLNSWRASLFVDCAAGLVIAWIFWRVARSSPAEHPGVNASELALIGAAQKSPRLTNAEFGAALLACTRSRSLWCCSMAQALQNLGWGFLVTWLPTYLVEERGVGQMEGGRMVTCVLAVGMLGQLAGGALCDYATARLGLRWGRIVPLVSAQLFCATAYLLCPFIDSTWGIVGLCAVVSFCTDLGTPAIWAFMGDIGGRATAVVGGWGNMWGNFGGSAVAFLVPHLLKTGGGTGRTLVFFSLAGSFIAAALLMLPMNATRKILPDAQPVH
jgi:ACS family glucarate transporter-like MFS transporter